MQTEFKCACGRGSRGERACCDQCGGNYAVPTPSRGAHSWLCDLFHERDSYREALEVVLLASDGVASGRAVERIHRMAREALEAWSEKERKIFFSKWERVIKDTKF